MKRLFICTVALALLAAVPSVAARGDNRQGDKRDTATQSTKSHSESRGTHKSAPARAMTAGPQKGAASTQRSGVRSGNRSTAGTKANSRGNNAMRNNALRGNAMRNNAMRDNNATRGNAMRGNNATRNNAMRDNKATRGNNATFNKSMSGKAAVRHPSINSLRRNVHATRRFHNGDYRAPHGYQARQWSHGGRLPRSYFVRDYWITDFLMFGLFAPPPDLIWVRVGNDALLVDRYSGDIVQVDYDVFY